MGLTTEQKKEDAVVERQKALVALDGADSLDMLFEETRFNQMQRAANMFAESQLVPEHFRKKPANVMVALQLSYALQVNPLLLMMKIYEVHGKFGFEAQLMIALANSRGPFKGSIRYRLEGEGDNRRCTAYAYHKDDGEICEAECSIKIAKAEGWFDRKDRKGNYCSKWRTMPDLMLQYRSATFLVRTHCPDVLMGMPTSDELEDRDAPALQVTATVKDIDDAVAEATASKAEPAAEPKKQQPDPAPPQEPEKPAETTAPATVAGSSSTMHDDLFVEIGSKDRTLANHVWQQCVARYGGPSVDTFLEDYKATDATGDDALRAMMAEYGRSSKQS